MRLLSSLFLSVVLSSCALASSPEPNAPASPVEAEPAPEAAPEGRADEVEAPLIPSGRFDSLEALCEEQKKLAAPSIAEALAGYADRGETDVVLVPRCDVSTTALLRAVVAIGGPFLEISAIEVETGHATRTHVVVRTKDGWFAAPRPAMEAYHDDPGCGSIERDAGILAVRVERGALVIVTASERLVDLEEGAAVYWDEATERARACRLGRAGLSCDEPVTLRVERVPSTTDGGRSSRVQFETTVSVGADGDLVPAHRYEAEP